MRAEAVVMVVQGLTCGDSLASEAVVVGLLVWALLRRRVLGLVSGECGVRVREHTVVACIATALVRIAVRMQVYGCVVVVLWHSIHLQ